MTHLTKLYQSCLKTCVVQIIHLCGAQKWGNIRYELNLALLPPPGVKKQYPFDFLQFSVRADIASRGTLNFFHARDIMCG